MTLVLDSGALVALERAERAMWRRLKAERLAGRVPLTHGGVVAQVWRGGGGRQAQLARALRGIDVAALDDAVGRAAGVLLGRTGSKDAVDAALVALAADDDRIVTSDPGDIRRLVAAAGRHIDVVRP
jgi:hypothetical protein